MAFLKQNFARTSVVSVVVICLASQALPLSPLHSLDSDDPPLVEVRFVGEEFTVGPTNFLAGGFPDGQVTFIRDQGEVRMWVPVSDLGRTVEFKTKSFLKVWPATDFSDSALLPNGRGFGPDYLGGSKVVRLSDTKLVMLVHGERQPCAGTPHPAIVTIGIATSDDNGESWDRGPAVISGPPATEFSCSSEQFYGAGSLTAAVDPTRTWLYVWFQHWGGQIWGDPIDGIKVARARISDGLGPGTWWKYNNGNWDEPGLSGRATTVIRIPEPIRENDFAGIPTVTWNPELGLYVAVFTTYTGFWWASSDDGVRWSEAGHLLDGKSMITPGLTSSDFWYYYPSLIDPRADEDGRSAKSSILYYSKGGPTNSVTNWFGRRVRISQSEVTELPPTGFQPTTSQALNILLAGLVVFGLTRLRRSAPRIHIAKDLWTWH